MVELAQAASHYPCVDQSVRFRYRLGSLTVDLRDRPLEVVPGKRLRSDVALGLFRFQRTYALAAEAGGSRATRLSLKLVASNAVPVVGGMIDRFDVRRFASEFVDTRLRSIRRWCEGDARPAEAPGAGAVAASVALGRRP